MDVLGATGFGLAIAAEVAAERGLLPLTGARVVVQGFGSVGQHAARFLRERGAVLVAASDSRGATTAPDGFDVDALIAHKRSGQPVGTFPGGHAVSAEALVSLPCEIWIPAARPDVITAENVAKLDARLLLQGANIPASPEAEQYLHEQGVTVIPDFIANAGGVICAAVEYAGGTASQAFAVIAEKIRGNTQAVLQASATSGRTPRAEAEQLAVDRVTEAMAYRRR